MTHTRPDFSNQLLNLLGNEDLALLEPHFERITLGLRAPLEEPDRPIENVYFVESGLISMVAKMSRGRDIEVGVIGREGMTGLALVQGDDRGPYDTYVQMEGEAIRLGAAYLSKALQKSSSLRALLSLYGRAFAIQVSSTALANGRSKLEERLARWLLMVRDRLDGDRIELTHEFLAVMLGVRRPGVTVALHILEGKGLIRSHRGEVIMVDREGLTELADGAYGVPEREYARLLEPSRNADSLHLVV